MKTPSGGYLSTYGNDHILFGGGQGRMQDPANAFNVYKTPYGTYIFQSQLNGMYLGLCANSELACFNIADPSQAQHFAVATGQAGWTEILLPEGPPERGRRRVPEWLGKRRQENNWSWKNVDRDEHLVSITSGWNQLAKSVSNNFTLRYANLASVVFQRGSDFTDIDFSGANLDGTIFELCDLTRANFTECSLNNARMTNATVNETIFNKAKLNGFHLGTTFWKVKANGASLNEANLSGSSLNNTELRGATFNGANFSETSLNDSDLSDAIFNKANLTKAFLTSNFSRSILNEADLSGATLLGTGLSGAKLNKTNLTKATLTNVDLSGASLDEANFTGARLNNTNFAGASLNKTDMTNAAVAGGNFSKCDLTTPIFNNTRFVHTEAQRFSFNSARLNFSLINYDWQWLDLQNATIEQLPSPLSSAGRCLQATGANLSGLNVNNFEGATLSHAILNNSVLDHLVLSDADLSGASLISATLHGTTLTNANLHGANLTGAQLGALDHGAGSAASMVNAYLPDANLTGANLFGVLANNIQFYGSKARLDGSAILEEAQLNNANLSNLDLTQAQLRGTNLSGSHLFNVKFNNANLTPSRVGVVTNLSEANLQGADFTDAQLSDANLSNAAVAINVRTSAIPNQGGVYLFTLPYSGDAATLEQYIAELSTEPSLTKTCAAFKRNSLTLSSKASAKVETPRQQWLLDNDSENPENFTTGYVRFVVKLNGNVLDVYGTALRILRIGDNNQQEFDTETCQITKLSQTNMNANTICPNGTTLSVNQSRSGKSWDTLWLRAVTPPRPPDCVPTDNNWCPPPKKNAAGVR